MKRQWLPVLPLAIAALLCAAPLSAQVVRLEIASREPMNGGQPAGAAGPFELIRGKVHGEIDPKDRHNTIIQDLGLAPRNARGNVEYVATFALAKPLDMSKASRRARSTRSSIAATGRRPPVLKDTSRSSAAGRATSSRRANNQSIAVPVARKRDGSRDHRPRPRPLLRSCRTARRRRRSASPRWERRSRIRPPISNSRDATLTWHTRENYSGRAGRRQHVATQRLGLRQLRVDAVAGHTRPDAHLPQGRFPRRPPLRARLHGERSAGARRRPGRDA